MFLLFKYIHAAGLFQFSNISSISHRLSKGGGRNVVAKEQDLDTKLAELLAGGTGGSSAAHGGSEFVHCFVGWHLWGLGEH